MPLDEKNDDEEAVYVQHQSSNRWKLPSHERPSKTRASRANVPITVRIDDIVTKEQEPAYLEWQRGISSAQERFVADRFGKDAVCMLLRKSSMKNSSRYIVLFRFPNREAAFAWETSSEYQHWVRKLTEIGVESTPAADMDGAGADTSTDYFPIFDLDKSSPRMTSERWHFCFLVWCQVYVLCIFWASALPKLLGSFYTELNFDAMILVSTVVTTLTMELMTMRVTVLAARRIGFLATPEDEEE